MNTAKCNDLKRYTACDVCSRCPLTAGEPPAVPVKSSSGVAEAPLNLSFTVSYRGARLTKKKEDGRQTDDRRLPAISNCGASSRVAVSVNFPVIVRRLYAVRVSVAIVIR
jgi:hypothetical protein